MKRSESLDALRGVAILLMVLSGSIAFGNALPGWMFHAQVPPPNHVFNPDLPGITWVDLVFPFFLFSMGAAIPLALRKRIQLKEPSGLVFVQILKRFLLLFFFAVFSMHARAWVMSATPSITEHLISIGCFVLLFLIYGSFKGMMAARVEMTLKAGAWILALAFLVFYPFKGAGFSIYTVDVIILVLANMALFGTLIWWFTREKPLWRMAVLPFVMAVFLASTEEDSLNMLIFNWSPFPWLYKFYYLKYLFIILPATLAGEWLLERKSTDTDAKRGKLQDGLAVLIIVLILIGNLAGLYMRLLIPNFICTLILSAALLFLLKKSFRNSLGGLGKFVKAGLYFLLLGLFFEAYQGGIKKDFSTYSYYFVCTGLAFLTLGSMIILEARGYFKSVLRFFAWNGKNPMIAYTAGNLLLIPLLKITGASVWLDSLTGNAAEGLLRGIIFTGVVSLITVFFVKRGLFWKT